MSEFKNLIAFTSTIGCGISKDKNYDYYFIMIGLDRPYENSAFSEENELKKFLNLYQNEYLKNVHWRLPNKAEIITFLNSDECRQIYNNALLKVSDHFSFWYMKDYGIYGYAHVNVTVWDASVIFDFSPQISKFDVFSKAHHIILVGKELKD